MKNSTRFRAVRTAAILAAAALAAAGCALVGGSYLGLGPPQYLTAVEKNVMVPMRDGVRLATDIYKPLGADGPFPVIVTRLPYDKDNMSMVGKMFAARGYVHVVQDCRACFKSEGDVFIPMVHGTEDGMDTVDWIAGQSWFNGDLGGWGPSYLGITQWAIAADNPRLKCMCPQITTARLNKALFVGGAFSYRLASGWSAGVGKQNESASPIPMGPPPDWDTDGFFNLPLKPELDVDFNRLDGLSVAELTSVMGEAMGYEEGEKPPEFVEKMIELMNYPAFAEHADAFNFKDRYERVNAPALMVSGWYDIFVEGQIEDFLAMKRMAPPEAAKNTRLIIGPWGHVQGFHPEAGKDAGMKAMLQDFFMIEWYDHWLRGEGRGFAYEAPIRLYVMGANEWRDENEWPLARTRYRDLYIRGGGGANSAGGDGFLSFDPPSAEPADEFVYDPRDPVPTVGGNNLLGNVGPKDQAEVEEREDVLVYSTPPLDAPVEVTGPVSFILHAASSAVDTDFTVKLCDVYPDGTSLNLTEGIVRARYRESIEEPSLIEPGKVYEYDIELWPTSNLFRKGHRIRVQVSSSSFPRFDRNANAGGQGGPMNIVIAEQTVFHDKERASRLVLPVIP